jgi:hypothetical protein
MAEVDYATNAVSCMHIVEGLVDLLKRLSVGNEFIN